jgi:hypothetical protein
MKYRRWLLMLVCLLALAEINKITATQYKVVFQAKHEYTKPNIKWMPCDMFWTPSVLGFEYD